MGTLRVASGVALILGLWESAFSYAASSGCSNRVDGECESPPMLKTKSRFAMMMPIRSKKCSYDQNWHFFFLAVTKKEDPKVDISFTGQRSIKLCSCLGVMSHNSIGVSDREVTSGENVTQLFTHVHVGYVSLTANMTMEEIARWRQLSTEHVF